MTKTITFQPSVESLQAQFQAALHDARHPLVAQRFPIVAAKEPFGEFRRYAEFVRCSQDEWAAGVTRSISIGTLATRAARRIDYECLLVAGGRPREAGITVTPDQFGYRASSAGSAAVLLVIDIGPQTGHYEFGGGSAPIGPTLTVKNLGNLGYELEAAGGGRVVLSE